MSHRLYRVSLDISGALWLMAAPPPNGLTEVVAQCKNHNISLVVSLLGDEEAAALCIADEDEICDAHDIGFIAYPIVDFGLPEDTRFDQLVGEIADRLKAGEGVVIHCRAGIGRTGTTASCVLQELGHDAQTAMAIVGKARGIKIPDTLAQDRFIREYGRRSSAR